VRAAKYNHLEFNGKRGVRVAEDYENFLHEVEEVTPREDARPFSHDEMVTCGECLRANPPTRPNCFYCGARLTITEEAARLRRPILRQPEKWEEGFNVVLYERAAATPDVLREVTSLLRLEREEAGRILEAAKLLPLARLHSREEAQLVSEKLRACGLSAVVISDSDLMLKDEARRRARAFSFTDDALLANAAGGSEVWRASWPDILLLVTGRLVVRRVELEQRRKGVGSEVVDARETAGDVLVLDLYTKAPDGGWRVASDQFDFSCLAERKALVAAQNFASLIAVLRERATQMEVDDSYNGLRQALAPVWPPEERTESGGLRRERPGRFNVEAVMTSDNEAQFTRYSRLRHFLKLREAGSEG
jgi:hypothetical protein